MFSDRRHFAVALAGLSAFLNLYAPQAVLPVLAHEFGVGVADISLTMTASSLAVALTAPFTGAIADVLGRKRVISVAVLALIVPTVMVSYAGSLDAMIFWRFVQGLLLPPIFAVTVAYIGDEWPAVEATGVTGLYVSASSVGGFLGRFLTGILADTIGWRGAFLVDAAITAACAFGIIILLPRERRFVRAPNLSSSLKQMLKHLRNPQLIATYAVGFGVLFNFIATFTYVNFLLARPPFNLSPTYLGSIFVVYLLGTAASPLTGRAVQRFGRRHFVIGAILLWVIGILLTLIPSLSAIICGLALAAACGMVCQASSTSYVATTAKGGVSSAVGLYVTAFYTGGSVGAFAPGHIWAYAGWYGAVALVTAMLVIMGAIVALVWTPMKRRAPSPG
jgi:predicted MFS family arabinose efflux permease